MPNISSTRKFVLVALADASDDNGICFPSIAHIIEKTSLDRKTVLSCIQELKLEGFISETGEMKGRTKQIPVIKLHLDKSPKNGTITCMANQTVPFFPPNSPVFPPKQSQKRDTEPYIIPKEPYNTVFEIKKERISVSTAAILSAKELAPAWDTDILEKKFISLCEGGFVPKNLNNSFLKWVKSYTKGKPPGEFPKSDPSNSQKEDTTKIREYTPFKNKNDDWRKRLSQWKRDEWWQDGWGPRPNEDGCRVPQELL